MSDSDEDELAQLRREREARLGAAGMTVTAIRNEYEEKNRAASLKDRPSDFGNDDEGPVVVNPTEFGQQGLGDHSHGGVGEDENDDGIPPELRMHLPSSFGGTKRGGDADTLKSIYEKPLETTKTKITRNFTIEEENEGEDATTNAAANVGPPRPPQDTNSDDDNNSEDDIGPSLPCGSAKDPNPWRLPVSSEAVLEPHARAVVALDFDHSGSRLLTGSTDYTVKIFDFNGMKSDCRPFRTFEPSEGHPIVALSWSPTGDAFLCVTGSPQPKIYDRDGKEQGELPRGDMYIRDMKNTKGHIGACSGGAWHPTDKGTGMTCSDDGTVRIWDFWTLDQKTVIKPTLAKPGRVAVTAATYGIDGRLIAAGLMDGGLQIWDVRGKFGQSAAVGLVPQPKAQVVAKQTWSYVSRTGQLVRGAHEAGSEITCLKFSVDGHSLLSRGADETLKLWDVRKLKSAVAVAEGLPTTFCNTQCCFSPDEKLIITGTSAESKEGAGALVVFDRTDLSLVKKLGVPGSAVAVCWHPAINQIVVGCGDRKEGTTRVLYDPSLSKCGALLAVGRRPRKETMSDFTAEVEPQIYNPNALPLFREAMPGQAKRKGAPVDASIRTSKSFKPEQGSAGIGMGAGGKLGTSGGTLLTQYIMKHQGQLKNPADEDVRASILRHEGKDDVFSKFTNAYASTQPNKIYAEEEKEEDEEGGDGGAQPPRQA